MSSIEKLVTFYNFNLAFLFPWLITSLDNKCKITFFWKHVSCYVIKVMQYFTYFLFCLIDIDFCYLFSMFVVTQIKKGRIKLKIRILFLNLRLNKVVSIVIFSGLITFVYFPITTILGALCTSYYTSLSLM